MRDVLRYHFVGTRRFNSSNQFSTTIMFSAVPPSSWSWPLRMITNRPSGVMSYGRFPVPCGSIASLNNTLLSPRDERRSLRRHRHSKHLLTVKAGEEQFLPIARPKWKAAAPGRDLCFVSQFRIPLDVDVGSTGYDAGLIGDPAPVWRHCRKSVIQRVFHQHYRVVGRTLDRNLPNRDPNVRRHFVKQELFAVSRPAHGEQIAEIFPAREQPLLGPLPSAGRENSSG